MMRIILSNFKKKFNRWLDFHLSDVLISTQSNTKTSQKQTENQILIFEKKNITLGQLKYKIRLCNLFLYLIRI